MLASGERTKAEFLAPTVSGTARTKRGGGPLRTLGQDKCRTAACGEAVAQPYRGKIFDEVAAMRTKLSFGIAALTNQVAAAADDRGRKANYLAEQLPDYPARQEK